MKTRREHILGAISDMMADFLYYHRKEDAQLPCGAIEEAIQNGEVTVEEMVEAFEAELRSSVEQEQ